jgi:predicted RNA-binding Zn ribbon-like protein
MPSNPAPGELESVRGFVNTYDAEDGSDELAGDPAKLIHWLSSHGLLEADTPAGAADVKRAVALREALRAILLHHDGLELDPAAPAVLADAARRARLSVIFDEHGAAGVAPMAAGVDAALGRLLAVVARAQRDGTWQRLKVCPAEDCQWAFYDTSRNRSAVWCDMKECGNRAKVRSYRERARREPD